MVSEYTFVFVIVIYVRDELWYQWLSMVMLPELITS